MSRPTIVLLLSKKIPDSLKNFFTSKQIKCITADQYNSAVELTHIVLDSSTELNSINDKYQTIESDIRLLSLDPVSDMTLFLEMNGRLAIDSNWFTRPMGKIILEKFFIGRASVHLTENFPSIKEHGNFKVTNHLRIGHDMDRLAAFIHGRNTSLVNVRTFVDHALYYACYLSQAKIGSAPYDVDYGFTGTDTVVQIHLPVRRFLAENLLDSFHAPNGGDPLKYILSTCVQSADLTEIQYIESASKLVISGLWQLRDVGTYTGFSGLLINHIRTSEQIEMAALQELMTQEVKPNAIVESAEAEVLVEKPLPGEVKNPEFEEIVQSEGYQETVSSTISQETETILKADEPEPESSQVIKGSETEKETGQLVKGEKEQKDNFSQKISADKIEKDNFSHKISADKVEKDNFNQVISSSKTQTDNSKMVISSSATDNESKDDIVSAIGQSVQGNDKGSWAVKSIGGTGKGEEVTKANAPMPAAAAAYVKEIETDLKKTKGQLELAMKELKIFKEMRKKMAEVDQKFKTTQLQSSSSDDPMEAIDAVNAADAEVRKMKLELQQKQVLFAQEIEKSQRQLKSRDLLIEKSKENIQTITNVKDFEIKQLNEKIEKMSGGQTAMQASFQQIKTLEQDKQSLMRLVDVYKNKLTVIAAKAEKQAVNPAAKEEEVRKLNMEKQTAQVALTASQKEVSKLKSRNELDQAEIKRLSEEKIALEHKLKAAANVNASMPVHLQKSAAEETLSLKLKEVENELTAQTAKAAKAEDKVKDLEKKVNDLAAGLTKASGAADQSLKTRNAHLEKAVTKMTQDLTTSANQLAEAKKDINKARLEKTALQNQLDKLKKELEKATAKAPGPKKAA